VRVDTADNRIIRIAGNPYHPLATTHPAPMETPVREVYAMLGGDNGLEGRATSAPAARPCSSTKKLPPRSQAAQARGPRGSGQWKSITLEELVQEICEGGDLFGEGHVDGLRAIRDVNTLIDEANPEYGPSPTSCW
jgi:tetrathionate reductase subunit A